MTFAATETVPEHRKRNASSTSQHNALRTRVFQSARRAGLPWNGLGYAALAMPRSAPQLESSDRQRTRFEKSRRRNLLHTKEGSFVLRLVGAFTQDIFVLFSRFQQTEARSIQATNSSYFSASPTFRGGVSFFLFLARSSRAVLASSQETLLSNWRYSTPINGRNISARSVASPG